MPWPLHHYGEVDNTMSVARGLAAAGAAHGTTVRADSQTGGRGRRGRSWFSQGGAGMFCTTILRPDPGSPLHQLGIVAGVAMLDTAVKLGAGTVGLKWPNDVVVGERKLAGLLLQAEDVASDAPLVMVGAGLNLAPASALSLPDDIRDRYVGLGGEVSPDDAASRWVSALQARYEAWAAGEFERVLAAWRENDALRDHRVRAEGETGIIEGTAAGVDAEGALLVRVGASTTRVISGEVIRVRRS